MSKIFPKSANALPLQILIFLGILGGIAAAGINYYATPKYSRVGYAPVQPVPFEHSLHAGQLGIDCRYCHAGVEKSGTSSLPAAQTCMNCHLTVKKDSEVLAPIRDSLRTGRPMRWIRVHKLPDYVYFTHRAHVTAGVGCVSCHGRIDEMERVTKMKPLSMSWCLECHRNPGPNRRPVSEVTNMRWTPPRDAGTLAALLDGERHVNPPTDCSGCHR